MELLSVISNIIKIKSIEFKNDKFNEILDLFSIWYNSDDIVVQGYILQKKNLDKKLPIIIYCRGGNSTFGEVSPKYIIGQQKDCIYLAENEKAIVFFPNYRGSSLSEGIDEFGGNDVNDIINLYPIFEQYRFCDVDKIAIYGVSRGGMMAYILATKVSWIKTIILVGAHYSMRRMERERPKLEIMYKEVYNLTKKDIKERSGKYNISRIPKNIYFLILHGTDDERVSVSHAYSIGKLCQKEGLVYKLILFPNGDHALSNYEDDVLREIDEWITKFL